ncbi:RdgB/HAM1 family non-canonical purine NTP pyrophosphatase [Candidatus Woesearchaeota archaeon]|nr:RdgB/HAM1 family non-canonical purine NTP pyrophosphatase [Candidatus Woesearchaeota archaeon]
MKIYFVTCNKGKVREFKQILEPGIQVEQAAIDYPELRSDDPEEIAKLAAKQLADKLDKPVVVEDSGLFIKSLNGFPGTNSAYIHKRIGLKGILKLMKDVKDRECMYVSAVAYCNPKEKPMSFLGTEKGKIAEKERGSFGFGHDPVFIPFGSRKTYGEIKNCEEAKRFRRKAVLKLVDFLKKKGR